MAKACNHNCFQCPYDDCIIDDITTEERAEINSRNAELKGQFRKRKKCNLSDSAKERRAINIWLWHQNNKDRVKAYKKEYYAKHRDEEIARSAAYYREHRAEINATRRERRRLAKEAKAAEAAQSSSAEN